MPPAITFLRAPGAVTDLSPLKEERIPVVRAWFPGRPSSASEARRCLRAAADGKSWNVDIDLAALLVSELVTNAVLHARTPVEMVVSAIADETLEVEVSDGSAQLPTPSRSATPASRGQGLHLLDALSDCWGIRATAVGKTVWFRLAPASQEGGQPTGLVETKANFPFPDRLLVVGG